VIRLQVIVMARDGSDQKGKYSGIRIGGTAMRR
jgi:hypothetical protein